MLTLQGVGINKAVTALAQKYDLTLTRAKVAKLKSHPKFHEVMEREAEAKVKAATLELKSGMAELVPYMVQQLKKMIGKGNAQAVAIVCKGLGMDADTGQKQATSLTVIMPGASEEKEVNEQKNISKRD